MDNFTYFDREYSQLFAINRCIKHLESGQSMESFNDFELCKDYENYVYTHVSFEEFVNDTGEHFKDYCSSQGYSFGQELLEWIANRSVAFHVVLCLTGVGVFVYFLALLEHMYKNCKVIEEQRERLRSEGFYDQNTDPNSFKGTEDMDEKQLAKYKAAKIKAYEAYVLLEKLGAAYDLMRIFTDAMANNTPCTLKQCTPSFKKLGYFIDQNTGKVQQDPKKVVISGTIESLGYSDPNRIKHMFTLVDRIDKLIPDMVKVFKEQQKQAADQNSLLSKIKSIFKVNNPQDIPQADKATAAALGHVLKTTLDEANVIIKQVIDLLSVVFKYEK